MKLLLKNNFIINKMKFSVVIKPILIEGSIDKYGIKVV